MRKLRDRFVPIFVDDPVVRETIERHLTPQFLEQFRTEYRRMMQESREGAVSFARTLKVQGWGHSEDMFDVVLREMFPQELRALSHRYHVEVIERLRIACGLHVSPFA